MEEADKKKEYNLQTFLLGAIMIILDSFWMLFYLGSIADADFNQNNYNWITLINTLAALISIILAIRVIRQKTSAWTAVPINLGLFCLCLLLETII